MNVPYLYSMILAVVQPLLLIAVLVAVFLLLLQLIRYFKNRNLALARENAAAEQKPVETPCCCTETPASPESGSEDGTSI